MANPEGINQYGGPWGGQHEKHVNDYKAKGLAKIQSHMKSSHGIGSAMRFKSMDAARRAQQHEEIHQRDSRSNLSVAHSHMWGAFSG